MEKLIGKHNEIIDKMEYGVESAAEAIGFTLVYMAVYFGSVIIVAGACLFALVVIL